MVVFTNRIFLRKLECKIQTLILVTKTKLYQVFINQVDNSIFLKHDTVRKLQLVIN